MRERQTLPQRSHLCVVSGLLELLCSLSSAVFISFLNQSHADVLVINRLVCIMILWLSVTILCLGGLIELVNLFYNIYANQPFYAGTEGGHC